MPGLLEQPLTTVHTAASTPAAATEICMAVLCFAVHTVSIVYIWCACRYVANETPGTKQAKLQLLEQLGWKCYSVTWSERYRT